MEYFLHILILICFYTILSQSLNLSAGFTGLISLAHAGFYGIGAYTSAILSTQYGCSFWLSFPLAMLLCGFIAYIVSFTALRTIDDYFIICTLGVQVILFSIMNNWIALTRGPLGIASIPSIQLFELYFDNKVSFFILSVFFLLVVWAFLHNISRSGFGKTLTAISEDEIYTHSIGKDVYLSKMVSFTLSAVYAALSGALYAHYISYIDPTSFTVNESVFILSIVIIGGLRNLAGSFWAATFLMLLPELLRFIGISESIAANMRQIIYGLILVIVMISGKNGVKEIFFVNR